MNYISFYSDENFYYCYQKNGKIYRGKNSKKFVPNLKYFISIFATLFLGNIINTIFDEKISIYVCQLLIFIGLILSLITGNLLYNSIERKSLINLKEVFLSDNEFNEYVLKGKHQFEMQKIILIFMFFVNIFLFLIFCFSFNLIWWFLGIVMSVLLVLTIKWIKPVNKSKFYKRMVKH